MFGIYRHLLKNSPKLSVCLAGTVSPVLLGHSPYLVIRPGAFASLAHLFIILITGTVGSLAQ